MRCGETCRSLRRRLGPGTDDDDKPARRRSDRPAVPAAARAQGAWAADLYRHTGREPRRGTHAKVVGLSAALRRAALLLGQMGLAGPGWLAAGPGCGAGASGSSPRARPEGIG
jgi:hypothetical protein